MWLTNTADSHGRSLLHHDESLYELARSFVNATSQFFNIRTILAFVTSCRDNTSHLCLVLAFPILLTLAITRQGHVITALIREVSLLAQAILSSLVAFLKGLLVTLLGLCIVVGVLGFIAGFCMHGFQVETHPPRATYVPRLIAPA